ncbi:hypothetical protein PQO74_000413 [Campylobacter lari]|uniref:hypothetical protein n=1 Tax=Campylobacter lari TaxID=201 RepID=UPI0012BE30EE|nr:hypothetical protein [Campylobacter lari]EAK0799690.1 hypothetical protein [Campylobacter lari]EAL0061508.1 hypothetical protein [Campylobacter lari]EII0699940.1 hypothetical protein [Campylobacter lari]EKL1317294.1 hypothetical protein [Campylobacter lari]MCR2075851.1 hypothetical protein [Campylobacter lari subsp. concheus]
MSFITKSKTIKIANCYLVECYCGDYCNEKMRLGVFSSFEKALSFIKKSFINKQDEISYMQESNNTYLITNSNFQGKSIRSREFEKLSSLSVEPREIRIVFDCKNFIQLSSKKFAEIGSSFYHDEIVSLN